MCYLNHVADKFDLWPHIKLNTRVTGAQSYLGVAAAGFPNMFLITGPGSPSVFSNMVLSIEQHVEWVRDCVVWLRSHGHTTIEADAGAQSAWMEHVSEVANATRLRRPATRGLRSTKRKA